MTFVRVWKYLYITIDKERLRFSQEIVAIITENIKIVPFLKLQSKILCYVCSFQLFRASACPKHFETTLLISNAILLAPNLYFLL